MQVFVIPQQQGGEEMGELRIQGSSSFAYSYSPSCLRKDLLRAVKGL